MSLLAASAPAIIGRALAGSSPSGLPPVHREVFLAARPNETIEAMTFYTRSSGVDLLSTHSIMKRSDTEEIAYFRYSADNGRTWQEGGTFPTFGRRPGATLRRSLSGALVDPTTGRFIRFYLQALLPTDNPLEGFWRWTVRYCSSEDGGMTSYVDEEVIAKGAEFNAAHPVPGVNIGRNSILIGDHASKPIFLADGTLIVPVVVPPVGPDGHYFNPGGGLSYCNAAVLRGRWAADGRHLEWELSELVKCDPALSTRGMDEPTVAPLADGRLLMVLRASNDKKPALPGRKWVSYSSDQGRTWTKPEYWSYTSGDYFFSPAASSQLITHSSGRLFWLGNIIPRNPKGNRPRYPFVIGEVDLHTGLLEQASVRAVDDRGPGDGELLALASPWSREDRETGEIVLNMTRWGARSVGPDMANYNWTADAYRYRIPVT